MQNHEDAERKVKTADELSSRDREGTYDKAGSEEMGALPNDPAENAKKTSPEEDAGEKEDTRLSADS
jgi:hypothetical protein